MWWWGESAAKCQFIKTKTFIGISGFFLEKFKKSLGPGEELYLGRMFLNPKSNTLLEEQNLGPPQEVYKSHRLGKGGIVRKGHRAASPSASAANAGLIDIWKM